MIKMLNEIKKRLIDDVRDMYPECKCLIKVKSAIDTECNLIAVSDDISDFLEIQGLCYDLRTEDTTHFYVVIGDYYSDWIPSLFVCKGD